MSMSHRSRFEWIRNGVEEGVRSNADLPPSGMEASRCCHLLTGGGASSRRAVMIASSENLAWMSMMYLLLMLDSFLYLLFSHLAWMSSSTKKVCATGAGSARPSQSKSTPCRGLPLIGTGESGRGGEKRQLATCGKEICGALRLHLGCISAVLG